MLLATKQINFMGSKVQFGKNWKIAKINFIINPEAWINVITLLILVALNYQTEDEQNIMNDAKFSDNGGCGFVLKPAFLRNHSLPYSCHGLDQLEMKSAWKINIKLLSGHLLNAKTESNDTFNPFVEIKIRGHPADEKDHEGLFLI